MSNLGKPKLLLVEDDPFMTSLMAEAFEADGFEVILANNGEAAIQQFRDASPAVAVMDILLPKKNGIEALREIRALPRGADLPVIVLSNLEDASYVTDAEKLGVKAYLTKANVQIPELVAKVKGMLAGTIEK